MGGENVTVPWVLHEPEKLSVVPLAAPRVAANPRAIAAAATAVASQRPRLPCVNVLIFPPLWSCSCALVITRLGTLSCVEALWSAQRRSRGTSLAANLSLLLLWATSGVAR